MGIIDKLRTATNAERDNLIGLKQSIESEITTLQARLVDIDAKLLVKDDELAEIETLEVKK